MYDEPTQECKIRAEYLWTIWTWISEMTVFLVVPTVILIFNLLVIREVRRVSASGPSIAPSLGSSTDSNSGSGAATTVMLLSVSFYVIATTLPATLVYVLVGQFPEGDPFISDDRIRSDPVWTRYIGYILSRKIVEEICLSHYACNFILYVLTGKHFRSALVRLLRCSDSRSKSRKYYEIARFKTPEINNVSSCTSPL